MSDSMYAVYGASGCGRGIMPLARNHIGDRHSLVFIDDNLAGREINGQRVVTYAQFVKIPAAERYVVLAIANGMVRKQLSERCTNDGVRPWTVISDNAVIMDDVSLGEGAAISPFVTLTSNIRIGRHFHANLYSYVEHDCDIGDFVTFAPGVQCNGNIVIEDHVYVGAGATIRQGKPGAPLRIGRNATVGMGAVVTRDVPADTVVVGNPARLLIK